MQAIVAGAELLSTLSTSCGVRICVTSKAATPIAATTSALHFSRTNDTSNHTSKAATNNRGSESQDMDVP